MSVPHLCLPQHGARCVHLAQLYHLQHNLHGAKTVTHTVTAVHALVGALLLGDAHKADLLTQKLHHPVRSAKSACTMQVIRWIDGYKCRSVAVIAAA
jgi:hypothetical protein